MTLGSFTPQSSIEFDGLNYQSVTNLPVIVQVTEYIPDFTSNAFPNAKPVVRLDVQLCAEGRDVRKAEGSDVLQDFGPIPAGTVKIGVQWGSKAVVDQLKSYAGTGQKLPVKIVSKKGQSGRAYFTVTGLDDAENALVNAVYTANPTAIDQARAAKEAESKPLAAPAIPQAASVAPVVAPVTPAAPPAPAAEVPAPPVSLPGGFTAEQIAQALAAMGKVPGA